MSLNLLVTITLALISTTSCNQEIVPLQNSTALLFAESNPYNLLRLFRRQETCVDPGYVPYSNAAECCPPSDDCYPNLGMCCIKGGVTCGYQECFQAGAICCPDTGACDGTQNQTCCDTGSRTGCCDSGFSCCAAGNTCCPADTTCCASGCCPPGGKCQDGVCVSPLPVLPLPYTPLVLDATVKNMCLWIRGQSTPNPNERTLTYSSSRNDGGKCSGCCTGVLVQAGNPFAGDPTSCDEAPFARTYEALNAGAHLACVDAYENSFQGWWFGQWTRYTKATVPNFGDKSQFIVQISGIDCTTVQESDLQSCRSSSSPTPTPKLLRARQNSATPTSGTETQVIPSTAANSTNNLMIVPLGDLSAGTYRMTAGLSGSISDVMLWDNMGDDVDSSTTLSTGNLHTRQAFEFTVSNTAIGAGLLIETVQTSASVTWNVQYPPNNPPKSTAPRSDVVPFVMVPISMTLMSLLFSLLA